MEIDKLKKIICSNKNVSAQHLKQLCTKLTEETTNTSVVSDLPKLIPVVFKFAVHEDKKFRESALPALTELTGLLDLNKHLKEKPWWKEMKENILKSVDVLMNLVSTGDNQWAPLWITTVTMLGSDLRTELPLLNRLLKVVEKAFKMNDEEVRYQGFECWIKLVDNFAIDKQELNRRKLALLVIPLKANNHNTPRLCAAKMKTWKHLLSKLDQHNEMTVQILVAHFLEFMFCGVGSIAPACKTLNVECANIFAQMLHTPLLFRILPEPFIKHAFVCIEHIHRDLSLSTSIWEGLLDNMKNNQWPEEQVSELVVHLFSASKSDKFGKSKTLAYMVRALYSGSHAFPSGTLVKHLKTVLALVLEPHVLVHYTDEWCNELLNIVAETNPIQLPEDIVGEIIVKLNVLAVSELFRDEKLKLVRGMWMTMTNIICKWIADDGQLSKMDNEETALQNIHQLLFFGAGPLSKTWNKLQMKSWKTFYSECVKYFSLSTEVKCDKFVTDLIELLLEGIKDKKIPLSVALDLVSIILEIHLSKDVSNILPLMTEVAVSVMNSFQSDTAGGSALLNQYLKTLLVAARNEASLVNDISSVLDKMLECLEEAPLVAGHIEKTRNVILKTQIQLNALKPCRSQDRSESPGGSNIPPATSPTMTSFLHRLAKSKETKSKVGSPTPSQSSEASSSPSHTPNSKKASSPFCDMKCEDFVFVPPKPRKILLTDHQKESLATRKHDIPALYQDLSQDSSQSLFDSIQVMDKEPMKEKESTLRSPQSFKEVNFKRMSPRKSPIKSLTPSSTNDKLQNNKENDSVSNNKKSPINSIVQETKMSEAVEGTPLKILQDDQTKVQENITENLEVFNAVSTNTRLRTRKSLASDIQNVSDVKGNTESASPDLNKLNDDTKSTCEDVAGDRTLEKDGKNIDETDPNSSKKETKTNIQDTTPVNTPKRSLRKNKLSISIEKSRKKSEQRNKQEEQNEKGKTNLSLNSISTPKVSPRRLRKRKSGGTPILTGGGSSTKLCKSISPSGLKETPPNNSVKKSGILSKTNNNKSIKTESTALNCESKTPLVKQHKEEEENTEDIIKSICGVELDKSITSINQKNEELIPKSSSNCTELKSGEVNEIEVIDIVKAQCENPLKLSIEEQAIDKKSKQLLPKGAQSLKNEIPCIDISCSPVKVVVERLPEILISANQFDTLKKSGPSSESQNSSTDMKISPVRNITQSLSGKSIFSSEADLKSNIKTADSNTIVSEDKEESVQQFEGSFILKLDETRNERKPKRKLDDTNPSTVDEEDISSKNNVNEIQPSENVKIVEKNHSMSTSTNYLLQKISSMDKIKTAPTVEKQLEEKISLNLVNDGKSSVNQNEGQNSSEQKDSPIKKTCLLKVPCTSASTSTEVCNSPSTSLKSSENTPIKSGQKHLKQTRLSFTPVRKTVVSKSNLCSESGSSLSHETSSKSDGNEYKSPLLVLVKMESPEINKALHSPKYNSENETNKIVESKTTHISHIINGELNKEKQIEQEIIEQSLTDKMSKTRQEGERTPEKASTSKSLVICLEKTEKDFIDKSITESPDKVIESEDIIASSQENDTSTQSSILLSCRNNSSNCSLKILSKSPKKSETQTHATINTDRVLRSSPSKTESPRFAGTPVRKSVCRRLDVEIDVSPESNETENLDDKEGKLCGNQSSKELSDCFKLLNGDNKSNTNLENEICMLSRGLEKEFNIEGTQNSNSECSPISHKNLIRVVGETSASSGGSPKRTIGSLRFESNSSPVSSPNSRTSQMMELAKQETEKTISSPIGSAKRRRVLPVRVGPVLRTPKTHIIHRTHVGPSEEWVRRTYSPTASPNSSILKRTHQLAANTPVSPDCSPPSSKKKRVSFLDPPVSESLLFSKAIPGKGQIQRPEPVQDTDSEELPSQGSVRVELAETLNPDAKVFSPLKQCASPLTDILERIVNIQWMSDLEAQLERLGVTTVGQLSCLPEETVERLPFIPPKLDRLRKILQNYYSEINEKPDDTKLISSEANVSPEKVIAAESPEKSSKKSPEKTVEDPNPQNQDATILESLENDDDVSYLAETIKSKLDQYPELIRELGNKLHIDIIMKLLDFAVSKLKTKNEES